MGNVDWILFSPLPQLGSRTSLRLSTAGSGKTYTMQPLPLRAAEDMLRMLDMPYYRALRYELWISFFEIYGGKLYDLLNDRQ